jgi:hypothetical protein
VVLLQVIEEEETIRLTVVHHFEATIKARCEAVVLVSTTTVVKFPDFPDRDSMKKLYVPGVPPTRALSYKLDR